ncbi:MAG: Ribosomal subunit interface protein, partial [Patescibacteria group bacterium]|nr:Ribosomal subunit interface protein [Patescibacteria group bacterium]
KTYRATSETSDLYAAVDDVKDDLFETITSEKDRNQTLWKRGARSVKKMLKGISKRNPFTSKY